MTDNAKRDKQKEYTTKAVLNPEKVILQYHGF